MDIIYLREMMNLAADSNLIIQNCAGMDGACADQEVEVEEWMKSSSGSSRKSSSALPSDSPSKLLI